MMKYKPIDTAGNAANISEMADVLTRVKEAKLIEDFLYCLLTKFEIDEISKRWALVKDLANGISQREIASRLGLSLCKITRGSRELKKPDSAFRKMMELAGITVLEKSRRKA